MKSTIRSLVAVAALTVCASTQAQTNSTPATHGTNAIVRHAEIEKMIDDLGVTTDQKQKLLAVIKDQGEKRMAIRNDTSLTDDVRRDKMKELMASTKTKISSILTPEQFAKWQKMAADRFNKMRTNSAPPTSN